MQIADPWLNANCHLHITYGCIKWNLSENSAVFGERN